MGFYPEGDIFTEGESWRKNPVQYHVARVQPGTIWGKGWSFGVESWNTCITTSLQDWRITISDSHGRTNWKQKSPKKLKIRPGKDMGPKFCGGRRLRGVWLTDSWSQGDGIESLCLLASPLQPLPTEDSSEIGLLQHVPTRVGTHLSLDSCHELRFAQRRPLLTEWSPHNTQATTGLEDYDLPHTAFFFFVLSPIFFLLFCLIRPSFFLFSCFLFICFHIIFLLFHSLLFIYHLLVF